MSDSQDARSVNSQLEQLLQRVDDAQTDYLEQKKQRQRLVNQVLGQLKLLERDEQKQLLEHVANSVPAAELSEAFVKQAAALGAVIGTAASFRECLTRATRKRQLSAFRNELALNAKSTGYKFVRELGVRCPRVLSSGSPFAQLKIAPNSVLKPANGSSSNGLFLITEHELIEVKSATRLAGLDALSERVEQLLADNVIKQDRWILEEFIGDCDQQPVQPARDLKFYCFYGEIGLVLEVDRQQGGHYCEWMADGTLAKTGRYRNQRFSGKGFLAEHAETALRVSRAIPAPFMRIDFLASEKDFVFGEFTPRPGQYNSFNHRFDRYLGELYLNAEARLHKDLINGKTFNAFNKVAAT